jgi:hypothetical protein
MPRAMAWTTEVRMTGWRTAWAVALLLVVREIVLAAEEPGDILAQVQKPPAEKPAEKPPPTPADTVALEALPPLPPTGLAGLRRSDPDPMWGDQGPINQPPILVLRRVINGPGRTVLPAPSLRGFKIADHESAEPLDRAYVAFNFYDDVNAAVDRRLDSAVRDERVYRETFGLEKTFFDERTSLGLRLPLNTLSGSSDIAVLNSSSTDVGDLSVILKYAAWRDESGDVLSIGLAVTTPTGSRAFAGSVLAAPLHSTALQPYLGYLSNRGDFYVHGFSSIDVPTDRRDVTMLYNDAGVGYRLYHANDPGRLVTAVVPTFEVHVNTPLDHRGSLRAGDPAGTADVVDLTMGSYLHLGAHARLGAAVAVPVTGPRPFDVEAIAHLEWRF